MEPERKYDQIRYIVGSTMVALSIVALFLVITIFYNDTFWNQFWLVFYAVGFGYVGYLLQLGPRRRTNPRHQAEMATKLKEWQKEG